ncbi:MAG: hypothetical protein NXI00_22405 [Cytophagales bacterium]|nr:hypothetical protein [Cytophagales bacterium]
MKYTLLILLLTSGLIHSSCEKREFVKGGLDTIKGSYSSDVISIETPKEKVALNLILHFNKNGENGSFNARLSTTSTENQIALDLGGEIFNISENPNSQVELEQIVLINLEDYMALDVNGELNKEADGIVSVVQVKYGNYNEIHQIVFRPYN